MIDRATKLRWRRRVRRRQRQFEDIGSHTEESLDKHFFRRLGRLYEVRRFLLTWMLLLVSLLVAVVIQTRSLGGYFLKVVPVAGGIYSEGIIGSYTNSNPIYATTEVDASVSRLLFSGLLTYSADNQLVADLAEDWSVDETGKVYTVHLRQGVTWHDKRPVTADDVVFTYQTIQNPDARSPLFSAWAGITVAALDANTITFTLPNVLASFPYSLTNGIIPKHRLEAVTGAELRGSLFNTVEPVGSGPFSWGSVEVVGDTVDEREQRIELKANEHYYKGAPKVNEFIIRTYLDEAAMIDKFRLGELNAITGAVSIPINSELAEEHSLLHNGAVMVFLKTSSGLLKDANIRRALTMATDQKEILRNLDYVTKPVAGPLLPEHNGFDPEITQHALNLKQAGKQLEAAGWKMGENGFRFKDGNKLSLGLTTLSSAEYAGVASQLQKQWRQVGVDLVITSLDQEELQQIINERNYEALMYGIVMGLDPDQFAFWHSSQTDVRSPQRLNFSDYKSTVADTALEAGRTRTDPELRIAKYRPFLAAWQNDAPAIALYRPRFIYTTYGKVYNFEAVAINSPADRFVNVENWMIRTDRAAE